MEYRHKPKGELPACILHTTRGFESYNLCVLYSNDLYKIIIDSNHASRLRDCVIKHGRDCVFLLHTCLQILIMLYACTYSSHDRRILESHVHGHYFKPLDDVGCKKLSNVYATTLTI